MKRILFASLLVFPLLAAGEKPAEHDKRIAEAGTVLTEIMTAPDQGIPSELLDHAHCVAVVPSLKRAGFIVGGKYGKGVFSCRLPEGGWSAPSTIRIEGGNIGLQIGAGETDVIVLAMNERGVDKLLKDKFTIGVDVSGMAGPVGRSIEAKTDALMHAKILAYSRSRGVFAGATLDGATLRPDNDDNTKIYGRQISHEEILHGKVKPTPVATELTAQLQKYSPRER